MQKETPVAVVGAGFIADIHLRILRELEGKKVKAICDKDIDKAKALAHKYGVQEVFGSAEELIQKRPAEHVHILTPPNAHAQVALPFLEAGWNVFLEKPMAETPEECKELILAAEKRNVRFYINHSFTTNAVHLQCKKIIEEGNLGKVHHILMHWNMPLRQVAAQQFGHWMFQKPVNILLEQCVHPLSQIYDILGNIHRVDAVMVGQKKLAPGYNFYDTWNLSLVCEKATAQIFLSVGQNYKSHGMTVICDDGQINVDFVIGVCTVQRKTRWPDFYDAYSQGRQVGKALSRQNRSNLWNFALSTLRIQKPSDHY